MQNNNLLLVADMQEGFRFPNVEAIIPRVSLACQNFKGRIVFTRFENTKDSHFERELGWTKFQSEQDREILSELKDLQFRVFAHQGLSLLTWELLDYLNEHRINCITLAGIYLDVSILKCCMDCFDSQLSVRVLSDCVTAQDPSDDSRYLASLARIIGDRNILRSEQL